jgi:NADPH-dependent 2,4-dienoyl-CoA reductase/sulfur reductase-like enzyme
MQIVVIGAGLAAANAIEELREQGYTGDIVLVGAERHLPYERPPLSKGLLLGAQDLESVFVHDADWYADQHVEVRLGAPVSGIDRERHTVSVEDATIPYDRLLLTTGTTPRRLPLVESGDVDVAYLRTLDDALTLKSRLSGHILVVGAGWIGLEVAAAAREAGAQVTVVENAPLPLLGVLGPQLASVIAGLHRERGVDLRTDTSVASVQGREVALTDGSLLRPDLIVVGIGVIPNDRLAVDAGLATGNGVLVDARLRTSDPAIFAAGDIANHDHPSLGRIRVEHWHNAIEQGKHAARAMLGDDAPYTGLPYFFSDQFDLGLEYVGYAAPGGYDEIIIRGDIDKRVITAFWTSEGIVVAGMHLNDWDAIETIRGAIGRPIDAALRDSGIDQDG